MHRHSRRVALGAAVALALSLATPVAAGAAPASVAASGSTASVAASTNSPVTLTKFRLTKSGYYDHLVTSYEHVFSTVQLAYTTQPGYAFRSIEADLYINGVKKRRMSIHGTGQISWPRSLGAGKAEFRNVNVISTDAAATQTWNVRVPTVSNVVAIRRMHAAGGVTLNRSATKVILRASGLRVHNANGSTSPVRRITVQRYSDGAWRRIKVVELNTRGNARLSFTQRRKARFRVLLMTTPTIQGKVLTGPVKV